MADYCCTRRYFPEGSAITFDTPETALGYFCGQRCFGEEETDPAVAAGESTHVFTQPAV